MPQGQVFPVICHYSWRSACSWLVVIPHGSRRSLLQQHATENVPQLVQVQVRYCRPCPTANTFLTSDLPGYNTFTSRILKLLGRLHEALFNHADADNKHGHKRNRWHQPLRLLQHHRLSVKHRHQPVQPTFQQATLRCCYGVLQHRVYSPACSQSPGRPALPSHPIPLPFFFFHEQVSPRYLGGLHFQWGSRGQWPCDRG